MADCLQSIHRIPTLDDRLFLVDIIFPPEKINVVEDGKVVEENHQSRWTEIIQAETSEEAVQKVSDFYKNKEWARNAKVNSPRLFKPRFNGGKGFVKFTKGKAIPDQYISHCKGGGINLHIYRLSGYRECYGCGKVEEPQKNQSRLCDYGYIHDLEHNQQQLCGNTAHCAGEQSDAPI